MDGLGFRSRLKRALVGDPRARFVFVGNFEVEHQWAQGELGLPRTRSARPARWSTGWTKSRCCWPARTTIVVLKQTPDPDYLDYLRELGLELPTVITGSTSDAA